jgi:hypothetical protein
MTARPAPFTQAPGVGAAEKSAVAAINTVQFAQLHNVVVGGESKVMQQARGWAARMGFAPMTREYSETLVIALEAACKHFENPNPDVKHGWFMVPVQLDNGISAEAHFRVDADDDIAEIEVWSRGQDLWPLLGEHAERDVNEQINRELPALLMGSKS